MLALAPEAGAREAGAPEAGAPEDGTGDAAPPPAVLLGDFNMLRRRTRASALLATRFPTCVRMPTYPVHRPQLSLDRIYLSPQSEFPDARVVAHGLAHHAYYHLPPRLDESRRGKAGGCTC